MTLKIPYFLRSFGTFAFLLVLAACGIVLFGIMWTPGTMPSLSYTEQIGDEENDPELNKQTGPDKQPTQNLSNSQVLLVELSDYVRRAASESERPRASSSRFLIQPPPPCTEKDTFLVLIYTAAANFDRRSMIRNTWGDFSRYKISARSPYTFRLVFAMGHCPLAPADRAKLKAESQTHHDILLGDFNDTYYNLTTKGMAAYQWIARNCDLDNVAYVFKTDDDVFVNMFYLIQDTLAKRAKSAPSFCTCNIMRNIMVERTGKYALSRDEYPDEVYPTFCQGVGYVMSAAAFRLVMTGIHLSQPIKMEDVYFTGTAIQAAIAGSPFVAGHRELDMTSLYSRIPHKRVIPNLGRVKDSFKPGNAQDFVLVHQLPLTMWEKSMAQLIRYYSNKL